MNIDITNEERYEFIKLYDTLRDMDFELTDNQVSVFEQIEEQENSLKTQLNQVEKKESILAKKLTDKYGKGSINLETGTFTPIS